MFEETLLTREVDLFRASAAYAQRSLCEKYRLQRWWIDGVDHVQVHD